MYDLPSTLIVVTGNELITYDQILQDFLFYYSNYPKVGFENINIGGY